MAAKHAMPLSITLDLDRLAVVDSFIASEREYFRLAQGLDTPVELVNAAEHDFQLAAINLARAIAHFRVQQIERAGGDLEATRH